jgi:probable rRNA maturation factor
VTLLAMVNGEQEFEIVAAEGGKTLGYLCVQHSGTERAVANQANLAREAIRALWLALPKKKHPGNPWRLSVQFTDAPMARAANLKFRGRDYVPNVLSFPCDEVVEGIWYCGDVLLALPVVRLEAKTQHKTVANHLQHLVIHGVLHLLGYDHMNIRQANEMEALERRVLGVLGIDDPYLHPADRRDD